MAFTIISTSTRIDLSMEASSAHLPLDLPEDLAQAVEAGRMSLREARRRVETRVRMALAKEAM
jgi:hypothetical protein